MPCAERIKRLRESLKGETAVIYTPISRFYLTGFEAEDGAPGGKKRCHGKNGKDL